MHRTFSSQLRIPTTGYRRTENPQQNTQKKKKKKGQNKEDAKNDRKHNRVITNENQSQGGSASTCLERLRE